jgi:hypothetical protein
VESLERTHQYWNHVQSLDFELEVNEGENTLTLGIFRIGRICSGAMRLELLSGGCDVAAPMRSTLAGLPRERAQAIMRSIVFPQARFESHETVRLRIGDTVPERAELEWTIDDAAGRRLAGVLRRPSVVGAGSGERDSGAGSDYAGVGGSGPAVGAGSGDFELVSAAAPAEGPFSLEVTVKHDGRRVGSHHYEGFRAPARDPRPGTDRYEERRRRTLEVVARAAGRPWTNAASQLARYALGNVAEVDGEVIAAACDYIDSYKDCADFALNIVLRLLLLDRNAGLLPRLVVERITDTALRFPYWTDEPGDNTMVTGTENHQLLFHAAEVMAGALRPEDRFSNSGMTGADHAAKGRRLARAWLDIRLRDGFKEWHSNNYYPTSMTPLLNLYDFLDPQEPLRHDCGSLLERMCFTLATDHFEGTLATVHARSYGEGLKFPDYEATAGTIWLLYGYGTAGAGAWANTSLATSSFRAPDRFAAIAEDRSSVCHNEWRQWEADFYVHRTPDYQVSALYDHEPGTLTNQIHPFQATFAGRLPLFFSCPKTPYEGHGLRPDYWSGNASLPRVYGHDGTVMLVFRLENHAYLSHLYFEGARYDEVVRRDGRLFARAGGALLGVAGFHGMEESEHKIYAGRELVCRAKENAWVVELGRLAEHGSLEAFADGLLPRRIERSGDRYVYDSPTAGAIEMGFTGPILHRGKVVNLTGRPMLAGTHEQIDRGNGT